MNDFDVLNQKIDNFKQFVKTIAKNQAIVSEYENVNIMQLTIFVNTYLKIKGIESVSKEMQQKLDIDDEHLPKLQKYLECFSEYLNITQEQIEESVKKLQQINNNQNVDQNVDQKID